jgi:hypothetical protein
MNPKASALLVDPHPCGHIVYPYTDRNLLAQAVSLYASAGLRKDEAVILIVRQDNYSAITRGLWHQGFDLQALERSGRLTCRIAEEMLPCFMVDGMPDEKKFKAIAESWMDRARGSFGSAEPGKVRAFGEMVCVLWGTNLPAASRLEELWGELIKAYSFSLLCSYALTGPAPKVLAEELVACHAHNLA